MKIYDEKEIKVVADFDLRDMYTMSYAMVGEEVIANCADDGRVTICVYTDGDWHRYDDPDADNFIGVRTDDDIVALYDWMEEHDNTKSVELDFCYAAGKAYAERAIEGKEKLHWKSYRGFANQGVYWFDDDEDIEPEYTYDIATDKKSVINVLGENYAINLRNIRGIIEKYPEINAITIPDDPYPPEPAC